MLFKVSVHISKDLEVEVLMEVLASTEVEMVFIGPLREKILLLEEPFQLPQDLEI